MTGPAGEFVARMLATLTGEHFSDDGWRNERKLDGVGAVAVPGATDLRVYSRGSRPPPGWTSPEPLDALVAQTSTCST